MRRYSSFGILVDDVPDEAICLMKQRGNEAVISKESPSAEFFEERNGFNLLCVSQYHCTLLRLPARGSARRLWQPLAKQGWSSRRAIVHRATLLRVHFIGMMTTCQQ